MKNIKKILITTNEHEVFIVRRGGEKTFSGFCEICGDEVEMLTLDQSVARSGKRTRELIRQTEARVVHSSETANGHLLVCARSLKKFCDSESS